MVDDHLSASGGDALAVAGGQMVALEALGVAVYATDAEGRLTAYNEPAVALWGWRPPLGDARWCGSWRLFHPDGTPLAHADCPMAVALRESRPVRGAEAIAERPDGTRVRFIPYPTPLYDPAGRLVGAVNVLVDVSARASAETVSAENVAHLRAVFETTPECIKLVAPDGTLLQMNASGLRMVEADSPAQFEGASVLDLIAPEARAGWLEHHERVCRGEALRWEFDIIGLRGTRRSMETHATPLRLPGGQLAQLAITRDITAQKKSEERQALLLREIDHRAKNALAVAAALVRLTKADDPRRFAEVLEGRIAALARAHGILAEEGWSGAELRAVVQTELAPYMGSAGAARVAFRGPSVWLVPGAVQPVSMVLHELATNAARHGALSAPGGRVAIAWGVAAATGDLQLRWTESGGPPLAGAPRRRGFGSKLVEGATRSQLGGAIRYDWEPGGLRCEITAAADRLQPGRGREAEELGSAAATAPEENKVPGRRVLLVEDEMLVAMVIEDSLRDLGYDVLGPAASVEEALHLIRAETGRIDAAVLDVNLGGRPSFPVADLLAGAGVPVIFVTGYRELPRERPIGDANVLLQKPFGLGELEAAMSRMLAGPPRAAAVEPEPRAGSAA